MIDRGIADWGYGYLRFDPASYKVTARVAVMIRAGAGRVTPSGRVEEGAE